MDFPLQGVRILNTRAAHQAAPLTSLLESYGGSVLELPLISMKRTEDLHPMIDALHNIEDYDWIIFTSANTVQFFFDLIEEEGIDRVLFARMKVAAVGEKTVKKLESYGVLPHLVPSVYDGEHLADDLLSKLQGEERVLFPRSNLARDAIVSRLRGRNITIADPVLYETNYEMDDKKRLREVLSRNHLDVITFTSPSTVHSFFSQLGKEVELGSVQFAVIGDITKNALQKYGVDNIIAPKTFTIQHMVKEIITTLSEK
ncbi:uroporphyrinogen-III synthase [Evansella sp. AB-rgal1]|uniref:uroporphyrinogen-III synthase n=1 Tax=Evansella sp. AB-rgal1 TaxID=3242696 RepID=UPI00359CEE94